MAKLLYRYTHPSSLLWRIENVHTICHTFCSGNSGSASHGVLYYIVSDLESHFQWLLTFFVPSKPWVTEVKYSDPGLHLASKSGTQSSCTVGATASKAVVSIHTGKRLQHLVITSWGKAGFSYRFPVGPGTENSSRRQQRSYRMGFCNPSSQPVPLGCRDS